MAYKQICNVLPGNVISEISSFIHEKPYKQLMFKLMAQEELKFIRDTLYSIEKYRYPEVCDIVMIIELLYEILRGGKYDEFMIEVKNFVSLPPLSIYHPNYINNIYWCVPFDIDRKDFYKYLDFYASWRLDKWAEIIEKNKQKRLNLLTYLHMCHTSCEY